MGISDPRPQIPSLSGVSSGNYPTQPKGSSSSTQGSSDPWQALYQSLTPDQLAQWNAINQGYVTKQRTSAAAGADYDKAVSGQAYNAATNRQVPLDSTTKGLELYNLLTPQQQQMWQAAEKANDKGFFQEILPILALAAIAFGGEALLGAGGGTTTAVAAGAETTAAAGEAATATSVAASALPEAVGTLSEVVVPVSGAGAGALGTIGAVAPELGAIAMSTADLSGATMPTLNTAAQRTLAQTMLQGGLRSGAINSIIAGVQGGNPLKAFERGFLGGAVGGGIGYGLQAAEASTGALDALGNTGIKAFNAAVSGAGTAAILGGDPVKAGLGGLAGSLGGSAMSSLLGDSGKIDLGNGKTFDLGQVIGSTAGSMAMSSLLGGGTSSRVAAMGGAYGANQPQKTTPKTSIDKPATTDSSLTFPQITKPTVTYPFAPYYGVGYQYGQGGVDSFGDESYWDDEDKLKKLMAALQQSGSYGTNGNESFI